MNAFDTDVLTEIFAGDAVLRARLDEIDADKRGIPIVAASEIVRGWLNLIRQAESGKARTPPDVAFLRLQQSLVNMAPLALLPYTAAAHTIVEGWKAAKIRVGTNDMRIAAICIDYGATLVTRSARDYAQLPGLTFDVWN